MDSDEEFVFFLYQGLDEPEARQIPDSFIDLNNIVSS